MCGILGSWCNEGMSSEEMMKLADCISSRGPDEEGVWQDYEEGLVLVHKRLSILDLSEKGFQPMVSESSRYHIVFNGEIYNHHEIRARLSEEYGISSWRGTSDTETILAAIQNWGVETTLTLLDGMFAFAVWDGLEKKITLARDHFGEKPLFWGFDNGRFMFSSELKPFIHCPKWTAKISPEGVYSYLKYGYVAHPLSLLENVSKLPPGHFISVSEAGERISDAKPFATVIDTIAPANLPIEKGDLLNHIHGVIRASVSSRSLSDVPLGSFLSGGIDSSLITAIMCELSQEKVKTFSVGFDESDFNESHFARRVASALGTEHFEVGFNAHDAESILKDASNIFDEPLADPSVLPMFHLSREASRHVKVVLSGDGADELFAGYNRHILIPRLLRIRNKVPALFHRKISVGLRFLAQQTWLANVSSWFPKRFRFLNVNDKLDKLALIFESKNIWEAFERMQIYWENPEIILSEKEEYPFSLLGNYDEADFEQGRVLSKMQLSDQKHYLPDDILTKVDRTTMRHSLEGRSPFLGPEVAYVAAQLPYNEKVQGSRGKIILRHLLARYLSKSYFERPKTGFGIPLDKWLRGDLRTWAENIISQLEDEKDSVFDTGAVRVTWKKFLSNDGVSERQIWCFLVLQNWIVNFKNTRALISESDDGSSSREAI